MTTASTTPAFKRMRIQSIAHPAIYYAVQELKNQELLSESKMVEILLREALERRGISIKKVIETKFY